jgi:hypothetical protein
MTKKQLKRQLKELQERLNDETEEHSFKLQRLSADNEDMKERMLRFGFTQKAVPITNATGGATRLVWVDPE